MFKLLSISLVVRQKQACRMLGFNVLLHIAALLHVNELSVPLLCIFLLLQGIFSQDYLFFDFDV